MVFKRVAVRRCHIVVIDALFYTALTLLWSLALATPAYAYVDPSVMTYTIQALAGVAVAMSAVLGVVWRRARKTLLRLLSIDEDAGKMVEPFVHAAPTQNASRNAFLARADEAFLAEQEAAKKSTVADKPLSWPARFGAAFCMTALLLFTYFVVAPVEVVGGNADSLSFGVSDVWWILIVFSIVAALVLAFALSLLRGKAFSVVASLFFSAAFMGFVQAQLLNGGLPSANGQEVAWGDYAETIVFSGLVWLAVVGGSAVLAWRYSGPTRSVMIALACVLIIAQAIGIVPYVVPSSTASNLVEQEVADQTNASGDDMDDLVASEGESEYTVTKEGLFEVSDTGNVIVFIVDTMDTNWVDETLAENPNMLDEFTGFTLFENSAGAMIPTNHAVPFLITGERLQADETYSHFWDTRYSRSTFIDDILAQGWSVSIYAEPLYDGPDYFGKKIDNFNDEVEFTVDPAGAIETLAQVAFYRDLPWALKPCFWYYTDDISAGINANADDENTPYTINDATYYTELQERGLTFEEDEDVQGCVKFIHLSGAHKPWTLNADGTRSGEKTSRTEQIVGVFQILDEYLRELKRIGVYDESTIIVTADHGYWEGATSLKKVSTPLCLAKPATEEGGSDAPCALSMAPVSQDDFHATVIDAVGGGKSSYGIGLTYFEIPEDMERVRYFDATIYSNERNIANNYFTELDRYAITGDARYFINWEFTGIVWMRDE